MAGEIFLTCAMPDLSRAVRAGGVVAPAATRIRHGVLLLVLVVTAISYLDRVCISMTAPFMQKDLGLSDAQMGLVFSAFTFAYAMLEIPAESVSHSVSAVSFNRHARRPAIPTKMPFTFWTPPPNGTSSRTVCSVEPFISTIWSPSRMPKRVCPLFSFCDAHAAAEFASVNCVPGWLRYGL